jgi:pimeloyl-ACP methyl ester carboxylesterase
MSMASIYKTAAGEQTIMDIYDTVLARWPVPYAGITLPTQHGDTFIIASGNETAPPLFLLHGSASNATAWIGDVEALSRHFRVFAIDTIGEPGRSAHNRPAWAGPAYADWLKDVLDGLHLEQAAVMGISQGGWTALKFATSYPQCISKLVLLAPGGVMQPKASFYLLAIPLSLFGRWGAERTNRIVFGKEPISKEAQEIMNTIMTHFMARKDFQPLFTDEQLSCLTMPVLIIGGAEDALFPTQKMAERLTTLLPQLTTLMLPDIGHVLVNLSDKTILFLLDGKLQ